MAYEEDEKRGFLRLNLTSLALTLGGPGVPAGGVRRGWCWWGAVAPLMLPVLNDTAPWVSVLRWPVLLGLSMAGLAAVYRFRPEPPARPLALGDAGGALGRGAVAGGVLRLLVLRVALRPLRPDPTARSERRWAPCCGCG
ncbi:MAG: hypothetical protein WDM92_11720 [Caulobacteraceae bacterium]